MPCKFASLILLTSAVDVSQEGRTEQYGEPFVGIQRVWMDAALGDDAIVDG